MTLHLLCVLLLFTHQSTLVLARGGGAASAAGPGVARDSAAAAARLARVLGGSARLAGPVPSTDGGRGPIATSDDLSCSNFLGCRWRNEVGSEGAAEVDELDWAAGTGEPSPLNTNLIFGTLQPRNVKGGWGIAGTGTAQSPPAQAMLVSDPIPCQAGDGTLTFRYWTSPKTQLLVCTREPGAGKAYDQCSPAISGRNPGPANVEVPPQPRPFEIVLVGTNYVFSAGGQQGGIVLLDDIVYEASICTPEAAAPAKESEIFTPEETLGEPGREDDYFEAGDYGARPTSSGGDFENGVEDGRQIDEPEDPDRDACESIKCTSDSGFCLEALAASRGEGGWRMEERAPFGNRHTGITKTQDGAFLAARGPDSGSLRTGPFSLSQRRVLRFCYFKATAKAEFRVVANGQRGFDEVFRAPELDRRSPKEWRCESRVLESGAYEDLEFTADNLNNFHSILGLDSIDLLDTVGGTSLC